MMVVIPISSWWAPTETGSSADSSFSLAKRFRELAGFTDDEVKTISEMDAEALAERRAAVLAYREKVGASAPD